MGGVGLMYVIKDSASYARTRLANYKLRNATDSKKKVFEVLREYSLYTESYRSMPTNHRNRASRRLVVRFVLCETRSADHPTASVVELYTYMYRMGSCNGPTDIRIFRRNNPE